MAEALLGIVLENLGSFVQDQLATYWGVEQQTHKLSSNLTAIRAVLRDAERKQITSHAVKDWLQKLTDAAYVLDDILDECSVQSKMLHSDDGQSSCLAYVHPKHILCRFYIGKRMKDITQRFHDIHEERLTFELRVGVTEKQTVNDDDDWRQTSSEGNVEVEDVGNKVWKRLYDRSFFQEAKANRIGMIKTFKMHDLFHDLAQSIMGEECVVYEEGKLTRLSNRVHYLRLLNSNKFVDMAAFKKVESLRTLLDFGLGLHHKLQILKLEDCGGSHNFFPEHMTQLQDLRHLVIKDCPKIAEMLPNIGKLGHLRTLNTFAVGSKLEYGLAELHGLSLVGKLHIRGLENVSNEWEAKEANLMSKKELNRLYLSWSDSPNSQGSNVSVERVLENLEPPSTLKSFGMKGYLGRKLSSWMRSVVVLKDLVEVMLFDCFFCEELPPLGKLPHLKRVELRRIRNVKWIDGESYEGVEEKAFPSLEKLNVENLPNLERLLRDEGVEMLPRLSQVRIDGVLNFKVPHLPCVEELDARDIKAATSFMEGVVENVTCLKKLLIASMRDLKVLPEKLSRLSALQDLKILECEELRSLPSSFQRLTNLSKLSILNCHRLEERYKRETGNDWQFIAHIPNIELESFPSHGVKPALSFSGQ
ncbi:hypothetical protein DEO72_LG4g1841 [Vigna unguiculata]|uniref:Uncharacterized protein n=1 Tax=Vigna unguiculata TaxID=3917 RepID=A0A4D6LQU7_VIGUN|nr:hypothetical protein DEO72_LG4g1841 [Vigna unguiculata]